MTEGEQPNRTMNLLEWTDSEGERDLFEAVFS